MKHLNNLIGTIKHPLITSYEEKTQNFPSLYGIQKIKVLIMNSNGQ